MSIRKANNTSKHRQNSNKMTLTRRKITPSPSYATIPKDVDGDIELSHRASVSSASPPPYDQVVPPNTFHPTTHLQIETQGKPWLSLPTPPRPVPIPVFSLDHSEDSSVSHGPTYAAVRPERSSGSCYLSLSAGAAATPDGNEQAGPVHVASTTTYRFGPNRPPLVRIFSSGTVLEQAALRHLLFSKDAHADAEADLPDGALWDAFTIDSLGLFTRSIQFRSPSLAGKVFQWRYATRAERKAAGADSLLLLERVEHLDGAEQASSPTSRAKAKETEVRTAVAHFVRNERLRTQGSGASSAGNGGRLMVDLGGLLSGEGGGTGISTSIDHEKAEVETRQMALAVVVTTCLVMLKREVDRRRAQQIAIMAGGAAGGP